MAKMMYYDTSNDILSIHKGFSSDEKFKGNIDIGDMILDVSTQKRIRGIEIMNASEYLKAFKITEKMLDNLVEADFNARLKPNSIVITLLIKSKNIKQEIPATIAIPIETPIIRARK